MVCSHHTGAQNSTLISTQDSKIGELETTQLWLGVYHLRNTHPQKTASLTPQSFLTCNVERECALV